jgi:hypothetical protein
MNGRTVARASYDFDGFDAQRGGIMSSGELRPAPSDLKASVGRACAIAPHRPWLLDLSFSERKLALAADVAHVNVTGDLPHSGADWRVESALGPV